MPIQNENSMPCEMQQITDTNSQRVQVESPFKSPLSNEREESLVASNERVMCESITSATKSIDGVGTEANNSIIRWGEETNSQVKAIDNSGTT